MLGGAAQHHDQRRSAGSASTRLGEVAAGEDLADQPAQQAEARDAEADGRKGRCATAPAMRRRTPLVKTRRRGSMCMGSKIRPNIPIRQSTIRKIRCTILYMAAELGRPADFPLPGARGHADHGRQGAGRQPSHGGAPGPGAGAADRRAAVRPPARPLRADRRRRGAAGRHRGDGEGGAVDPPPQRRPQRHGERRGAALGRRGDGGAAGAPPAARCAHDCSSIEFELVASHTLANLSRREADLLIREQVPDLAGIVTRKLGRRRLRDLCRALLELDVRGGRRALRQTALDRLRRRPHLHAGPALAARAARRRAAGDPRATTGWSLHEAARAGAGLAVLPCYLADRRSAAAPDRRRRSPRSSPSNGCWCIATCARCRGCAR